MSGIAATDADERIRWGHSALTVEFAPAADGSLRTVRFGPPDRPCLPLPQAIPVIEVLALGHGSTWSGRRSIDAAIGARLRLGGYETDRDDDRHRLRIRLADDESGLAAELLLEPFEGLPVVRAQVHVTNEETEPVTLPAVSSLTSAGFPRPTTSPAPGGQRLAGRVPLAPPPPARAPPLCSSRSCKRAAGLRARYDWSPLSIG